MRKTTVNIPSDIAHPEVRVSSSKWIVLVKEGLKVRRVGVALAGAAVTILVTAGHAFAQYPPSKAPGGGAGSAGDPSVAFTGTNITLGVVILVGLAVVGTFLLLVGRRRRVRASN